MKSMFVACFTLLVFQSAFASKSACIAGAQTIEEKLGCIPGLTFTEEARVNGARHFSLKFEQPVDHTNPARGTFNQRLELIHRGETEPMVLQTSGYSIFGVRDTATSLMFQTNQI